MILEFDRGIAALRLHSAFQEAFVDEGAEQFRAQSTVDGPMQSIAFTSDRPGIGKVLVVSSVSIFAARSLPIPSIAVSDFPSLTNVASDSE